MQIQSVRSETAHRLIINVSLCKSTLWQQVALMEKQLSKLQLFHKLSGQSSIAIKNTSSIYYIEQRWKQNAIEFI